MSTFNLSPKNPAILALIAVAAVYLLSRNRKAQAASATLNPNKSVQLNAANSQFYQSPAVAAAVQNPGSLVQNGIASILNYFTRKPAAQSANDGQTGDQAAAAYYHANQDVFASTDPFIAYTTDALATNPAPGVLQPNTNYVDPTDY